MAEVEEEIVDAGAEIIWVLERGEDFSDADAALCRETMDRFGSDAGWCVGDAQTEPRPGTWDESPLARERGFDLIVDTETMVIEWVSTHGTTAGNENLDGEDVLAEVQRRTGSD